MKTTPKVGPMVEELTASEPPRHSHAITMAPAAFQVHVSRHWFRFYWVLFVAIHLLDGLFLAGASQLYYWMLYQPVVVTTIQQELHLLPIPTLQAMVWVFPLLAVGQFLCTLEPFVYSILQGHLALTHENDGVDQSDPKLARGGPTTVLTHQVTGILPVAKRMEFLWNQWVYPFVALEGQHFDIWYALLQTAQIAAQTYQCYSLSHLVTNKWMNQLAVASTFCNCVSSPVIHYLVPKEIPRQRFLCVLVDSCLAFIQAVVLPFIIFYPYYQVYDIGIHYFPKTLAYNYLWYVEAVHNLDQIFIVSSADFVATVLPHLDFLRSLREISQWLRATDHSVAPYSSRQTAPVSVDPTITIPELQTRSSWENARRAAAKSTPKTRTTSASLVHRVLCTIYGFVIVVIHLAARNNDAIATKNCLSHPNPWFTKKYACSLVNLNCYRSGIQGTTSEVTSILQRFDAPSASIMVFSHCPGLEMPATLLAFEKLIGLNLYNTTLVQWNSQAALNDDSHPLFNYLNAAECNLSGIPEGITGEHLPATFTDVEFFRTNLSTLPVDIGTKWFNLNTLYLEHCKLKELPTSLSAMSLWYFSAVGNAIASIDDHMFENNTFSQFLFSSNPLKRFPATIGDLTHTCALCLEHTQVDQVSEELIGWALDRLDQELYLAHTLYGSPYCENAASSTSQDVDDPRIARYRAYVCAFDTGSAKGYFPAELIESQLGLGG